MKTDSEGNVIPKKDFYVTTIDKFMSNWGKAEGKRNRLIIGCDTYDEASAVLINAEHREDQKNVTLYFGKLPSYSKTTNYVQYKDKESMPKWFERGAF